MSPSPVPARTATPEQAEALERQRKAQTHEEAQAISRELETLCTENEPHEVWVTHHCYGCGVHFSKTPTTDCICDPEGAEYR